MIDKIVLEKTDQELIQRYSKRLKQFGADPRTLGWDSRQNQWTRFSVALAADQFHRKSVLDIGCGLADFYEFLREQVGIEIAGYTGIDVNPDLIDASKARFPNSQFVMRNILLEPELDCRRDVVVMLGVLNFRFRNMDNKTFAKDMIRQAFALSSDVLVVDMLSARADEAYAQEEFVFYYSPSEMLDFALSLTPHVTLRHDYASIPQREFMLTLRKKPCTS